MGPAVHGGSASARPTVYVAASDDEDGDGSGGESTRNGDCSPFVTRRSVLKPLENSASGGVYVVQFMWVRSTLRERKGKEVASDFRSSRQYAYWVFLDQVAACTQVRATIRSPPRVLHDTRARTYTQLYPTYRCGVRAVHPAMLSCRCTTTRVAGRRGAHVCTLLIHHPGRNGGIERECGRTEGGGPMRF